MTESNFLLGDPFVPRTGEVLQNRRTCPITFRLPENFVDDLKKQSQSLGLPVNTVVRNVLERYLTWERHANKMGFTPVTRSFLKEVFSFLSEEQVARLSVNSSKDALRELVLISRGKFDLESFMAVFNEWLKASGTIHRYEYDGTCYQYSIYHDLGKKWSIYLGEQLKALLKELGTVTCDTKARENGISISIKDLRSAISRIQVHR